MNNGHTHTHKYIYCIYHGIYNNIICYMLCAVGGMRYYTYKNGVFEYSNRVLLCLQYSIVYYSTGTVPNTGGAPAVCNDWPMRRKCPAIIEFYRHWPR